MKELVIKSSTGNDITTSQIIAEVFKKNHKDVLRDIQNLSCSEEFRERNFAPSSYISQQQKELPMYNITKDGFSFLVMGYTGEKAAEFKEKFIIEFNKRESLLKSDDYILQRSQEILTKRINALQQEATAYRLISEAQETIIVQNAPKINYHDKILNSDGAHPVTVIAKELRMGAIEFNRKLNERGIIFKVKDTWVLGSKYQHLGYTKTLTYPYTDSNGEIKTKISLHWTEKGRAFLHRIFNNELKTA